MDWIKKVCTDKNSKPVICQTPNVPLITWIFFKLLSLANFGQSSKTNLGYIATGALLVWSLEELFQGLNFWRRALGFTVTAVTFLSLIKIL